MLISETEAMWQNLSQIALSQSRLQIAERCFAALGDVAKAMFLNRINKLAEDAREQHVKTYNNDLYDGYGMDLLACHASDLPGPGHREFQIVKHGARTANLGEEFLQNCRVHCVVLTRKCPLPNIQWWPQVVSKECSVATN